LSKEGLQVLEIKSIARIILLLAVVAVHSDWLIEGHYSPIMPMGQLQACKNKAKCQIIINLKHST